MSICPQCQLENDPSSDVCQGCGASLTHVLCPECGAEVARRDLACGSCGAIVGTTRLATLYPLGVRVSGPPTTPNARRDGSPMTLAYLDDQQRYRLLEPLPPPQRPASIRVLDERPLQRTGLSILGPQSLSDPRAFDAYVAPYLQLAPRFYPAVPLAHEAWQDDHIVAIVDDREGWLRLSAVWHEEQPPLLQLLWWLAEMGKLWQPLAEVGCTQSLLVEDNLRLDEDQSLALCRLYLDPPQARPSLRDLGILWQQLYRACSRRGDPVLSQLIDELVAGELLAVEHLQYRLQTIAAPARPSGATLFLDEADDSEELTATMASSAEDVPTVAMPLQVTALGDAGVTEIGRRREHNEDFYGIWSRCEREATPLCQSARARGLYVVCDGMGGHAAGEVASRMAVEALQTYFETHWNDTLPDEKTIRAGIRLANDNLFAVNQDSDRSGLGRMGTTLVLALVQDTRVAIAHVGDSRIYRVTRKRGLEQLSVDHEVGQRDIQRGVDPEIAYNRPDAFQLTQALGPRESDLVQPDVQTFEVAEDTLLLLCTDGMSDRDLLEHCADEYLVPLLGSKADLQQGLQVLVDFANECNGHDNITAVLVRLKVRAQVMAT